MPIRTGLVQTTVPHPRFPRRFNVWLWQHSTLDLYTMDPLKASLCQRAGRIRRTVTLATRDTQWGEEIVSVELVPDTAQEAV
jgi:hypothetical protein